MIELDLRRTLPGFTLEMSARLPSQGVTALFGPSGCGKTTVLRALAGLERTQGRVVIDGQAWQDDAAALFVPPHRRALGYVIQEAALFPHLDVAGNLAFGRRRGGPQAAQVDEHAIVELLGIGPLLSRRPATLSGGERQRVAIARALVSGPRLLLMDEPLAALDAARRAEILPYLESLNRDLRLPVIYVTHAMDEVVRLADHLVLMREGRAEAHGALAEVLGQPGLSIAAADDAGAVLEAVVSERDAAYGLCRIRFAGGTLWAGDTGAVPGARVRAQVLARDVSVTRQRPAETSILNVLPAVLESVHECDHTVLLSLRIAQDTTAPHAEAARLLARITRRSLETLQLQAGELLYAQIKGVALMPRRPSA